MSRLIMFKAPWCGPCKTMEPVVDAVCTERNIEVIKINIDTSPDESAKWFIRAVPTIIFIDQEDKEIHRVSGAMTKHEFEILVDNL